MPVRFRSYNVPPPPMTGNKEVDDALSKWALDLSGQQAGNMLDQERLPSFLSTFSTVNDPTLGAAATSTLRLNVQCVGGETFLVSAAMSVLLNNGGQAGGKLRITYPGGSTFRTEGIVFDVSGASNAVFRLTGSYVWAIQPEWQIGGKHRFDLMTSGNALVTVTGVSLNVCMF